MKKPTNAQNTSALWFYGKHTCQAALDNPKRNVRQILVTQNTSTSLTLDARHPKPQIVDTKLIETKLERGATHQGVAILVDALPEVTIEDVMDASLLLILDQVTDPHNVGAILRSAAAFNAGGVIITRDHSVHETGSLAKAASGALEVVPLVKITNISQTMEYLKKDGFWCWGLDGYADHVISTQDPSGKIALVLGAEGKGLRRLTKERCDLLVKLPISDKVESLNVSNAAAVVLYELSRKHVL